jgi:hypothetical protein
MMLEARIKRSPKVLQAFLDACLADDQLTPAERKQQGVQDAKTIALAALRWGANPYIVVHPGMIKMGTSACGLQLSFGGSKDRLSVTDIVFDAYEFGDPSQQANNARRLEGIVLHETVHWVRQEAKATVEAHEGMTKHEAGQLFEQMAYGTLNCYKHEIEAAEKSVGRSWQPKIATRRHEFLHKGR